MSRGCKCLSQNLRQVTPRPHLGSLRAKIVLQLPKLLRERGKRGGPTVQVSKSPAGFWDCMQSEREGT